MSVLSLIRPELLNGEYYNAMEEKINHRLHANELPWSPLSEQAINFYPDQQLQRQLKQQLASAYQIDANQLFITRGSDDGIDFLTRIFLQARRDAFLQCPPTFAMYAYYVRMQQAQILQCVLDKESNFQLTLKQLQQCWQPNCKIIMLCSPNNPTGNLINLELIAAVCQHYQNQSVVVVDEAYIEFTDAPSATTLIKQYDNLIVLRTLSKAYGLAGLRLGSIIAQPQLIQAFNKIAAPYLIPDPIIQLALQALANNAWFSAAIKTIGNSRSWLVSKLQQLPIIAKVYLVQLILFCLNQPMQSN